MGNTQSQAAVLARLPIDHAASSPGGTRHGLNVPRLSQSHPLPTTAAGPTQQLKLSLKARSLSSITAMTPHDNDRDHSSECSSDYGYYAASVSSSLTSDASPTPSHRAVADRLRRIAASASAMQTTSYYERASRGGSDDSPNIVLFRVVDRPGCHFEFANDFYAEVSVASASSCDEVLQNGLSLSSVVQGPRPPTSSGFGLTNSTVLTLLPLEPSQCLYSLLEKDFALADLTWPSRQEGDEHVEEAGGEIQAATSVLVPHGCARICVPEEFLGARFAP